MLPLGVDLGGADSSVQELFAALSRECASLSLNLYVPFFELSCPISSHHQVFFAEQEIGMEDMPMQVVRAKKNSSLMMGLQDLKDGKIQAFLSLANTGALVVASSLVLGRLPNVHRPALIAQFPSLSKEVSVLDLGAYPKASVERLDELVRMGVSYVSTYRNKSNPLVGLLNIGHEAMKGTDVLRAADHLFKEKKSLSYTYVGFIEPIDIFQGHVDVAVTDGFTGNVLLKTAEGAQEFLRQLYISQCSGSGVLQHVKAIGSRQAALLLGVRGNVYKCHGRTSPAALSQVVRSLLGLNI